MGTHSNLFLDQRTGEMQDLMDYAVEYETNEPSQHTLSNKQLSALFSKMEIFENNGHLVAQIALEGFDPDDIQIKVSGKTMVLTIDRPQGTNFIRIVSLPTGVVAEQAQAKYEDNNLSILLPIAMAQEIKVQKVN